MLLCTSFRAVFKSPCPYCTDKRPRPQKKHILGKKYKRFKFRSNLSIRLSRAFPVSSSLSLS